MTRSDRWLEGAALLAVALGLALRLWHLFAEPLWLDEAYSAFAADHGFAFLRDVVPRYETHPPFYYSLLRVWVLVAGDGVAALRLVGLAAGVATLPLLGLAGRRAAALAGLASQAARRAGWAAAALGAVSIPLVEMSRQVRPYPVMILVYTAAVLALLALAAAARRGLALPRAALVAYLLLLEAMLWLHNMGPLFGASLVGALAVGLVGTGLSWRSWAWLAFGHLLVALAYLPGLLILLGQAPTWAASTWVRLRPDEVIGRVQMLYGVAGGPMIAAGLLVALAAVQAWRHPPARRVAALLLVAALLPVALSLLLSVTVVPVFITRTMTPVAAPALLLYALGAAAARGPWRWLAGAAVVLLAAPMALAGIETRRGGPMQDWYATVAWLDRRFRPGDQIFAYPNEGALPLAFALRDRGIALPIRAIPAPVPAFAEPGAWYPTGSRGVVALSPARLRAIAAEPASRAVPTIWLLRLGPARYDPADAMVRALHPGRFIVRHWRAGEIDLIGLRRLPAGARVRSSPAPARNRR